MPAHSHSHNIGAVITSYNNSGVYLQLQNDGNLVLYNRSSSPLWNSGTSTANTRAYHTVIVGVKADISNNGSGSGHTHTLSSHTHGLGSHTHTMSSHTHTISLSSTNTGASGTGATGGPSVTNTGNSTAFDSGATGSGTAHNNMPPYLAVYMWERVA